MSPSRRRPTISAASTTVARAPRAPRTIPSARWAISLSISLGSLTHSVMMGSINIAVPTMMTSLRAEVTEIQWVLTSFMIARTVVMPTLAWAKRQVAARLGSVALRADASETQLCTYLSAAVVLGVLSNALFGGWWMDSLAALVVAALALKEGRAAWLAEAARTP